MPEHEHMLYFKVALPRSTSDDKVHDIIEKARDHLKRLAGPYSRNHEFRHRIEDREARVGGAKGVDVIVTYVQIACRFNGLLNDETAPLKKAAEQAMLEEAVRTTRAYEVIELTDKPKEPAEEFGILDEPKLVVH
jgi:hypothetical protein